MASYGEVRGWRSGPLDVAEQELKACSDQMFRLANELLSSANPAGWSGDAAEEARHQLAQLSDRIEHKVSEVSAVRAALVEAADAVMELERLVKDTDGLAEAHSMVISDHGSVVDPGPPAEVPSGQREAINEERRRIKAELLDGVESVVRRANEIDDSLAKILSTAERGGIGDGGATTLAAAAAAGAAFGKPEIPGPPPDPPTDPGAGPHGVDPWYTRGDDEATKLMAINAAALADSIGWTHASKHLMHYLGNSGERLSVDPDEMMRDVPRFEAQVHKTTAAELRRISDEVAIAGDYGKPVAFSSGWKGEYIAPEGSKDWYYALGGVQYSVTGVATVHPPEVPGGQPRVEVDYKTHVFDRYNWDGGKQTEIGPITITDEKMAEMHRAGVAQEFDVSGSTDVKHYSGTLPERGERPDFPEAADSRSGTRTDPGR
ncbi:hypothetical protein SAMN05421810_111121 [Amycolatopsis arida]|uniref:Uncharacterized protein n=1 Tax=Amycolatopsis arida TaxID=587909 RepID=A0A1I6A6I3_9PSEU|nr:methyl-accepting chemotaxis protein [Amycolatopsis arida]TDX88574.1 hypothetical protein CLV69_11192 [Amycolatopsis arida]SFQ64319.1 hypothetical protein SAMN05421810_111121 [Amycolatopsis arida]